MAKYIMALDAGTTSNRCILFNEKGEMYDANKSADNKNTTEQIKTETVFKSTNKKDKSSKVKTGDETVVGMWSILMFISGLFGIRGFKRKKEI